MVKGLSHVVRWEPPLPVLRAILGAVQLIMGPRELPISGSGGQIFHCRCSLPPPQRNFGEGHSVFHSSHVCNGADQQCNYDSLPGDLGTSVRASHTGSFCTLLSFNHIKLYSFSISYTAQIFPWVILLDGSLMYKYIFIGDISIYKSVSISDVESFDSAKDFGGENFFLRIFAAGGGG
ncbi:hypothetical protein P7K49_010833 [Saguinus oedipus]|uniref:Uncharacterized protein n=1 Tax=Saguinus oedipus TaxID=9490 RepID=A0ABQ9VPA0_SAGOE|nr:hypothetical protein P7K49_010833 [Saguinus oedipus]